MEKTFAQLLLGKDRRRLNNSRVVTAVHDQNSFDALFGLIFHHERPLVMRAADAVEKITRQDPEYLRPHKNQLLSILKSADHQELKWHVAQLILRLPLDPGETADVWHILTHWVLNPHESKIVRVNALQSLFDISTGHTDLKPDLIKTIGEIEHTMIPSIDARIRKLKKKLSK